MMVEEEERRDQKAPLVLSEFRTRLVESEQGERLLSALLEQCQEREWRKRAWQAAYRFDLSPSHSPYTHYPSSVPLQR